MSDRSLLRAWPVMGFEIRKAIAGRRWIAPLLLAGLPVLLLGLRAAFAGAQFADPDALERGFARVFEAYTLRLGIFFSTVAVFLQLIRREIHERTLHFYLLAPLRAGHIVLGKYLAGVATVGLFFLAGTSAGYVLLFAPGGVGMISEHFLQGPGLARLAAYLGLAFVGIAAYGAVFLFLGATERNPIGPVLLILLFESVEAFLPDALQRISIVHALRALAPMSAEAGGTAGPSPLAGPVLLTGVSLALAVRKMRRAEVSYGRD